MGVVYEAEQMSLGRRVALKVLPFAAALDARQLQRFQNEAQAAAQLHHPHIVPVFAVGCEPGVHYYAMQFIDGHSLADAIAGGQQTVAIPADGRATPAQPLTVPVTPVPSGPDKPALLSGLPTRDPEYFRAVARLGVQAAEALEHAHQCGVVHRDVKPANLLVDGRGHLWVTDFGLARVRGEPGVTAHRRPGRHAALHEPRAGAGQARSPRPPHRHLLARGDAYELLTLRPPFAGDDREELLRQIAFDEPRRPRQVNPRVPRDLETIVLKAMEKTPADRYATAQELADDLRRFLDDEPIRARRPTPWQMATRWARRHTAVVAAAAARNHRRTGRIGRRGRAACRRSTSSCATSRPKRRPPASPPPVTPPRRGSRRTGPSGPPRRPSTPSTTSPWSSRTAG